MTPRLSGFLRGVWCALRDFLVLAFWALLLLFPLLGFGGALAFKLAGW